MASSSSGGPHYVTMDLDHELEKQLTKDTGPEKAPNMQSEFNLLPHEGRVEINRPYGSSSCFLINTVTLQAVKVPDVPYTMVYENGMGCVGPVDQNAKLILMEDAFRRKAAGVRGDKVYVRDLSKDPPPEFCLTERMCQNEEVLISIPVGSVDAVVKFDGFFLQWPRQRSRWFWSVSSLYANLKLHTYKGFPSKWAFSCIGAWRKNFALDGFSADNVLQSKGSVQGNGPVDMDHSRFLPAYAFSTVGLLEYLPRASSCVQKQGGLIKPDHRAAAKTIFVGLLDGLKRNRPRRVDVDLHFQHGWSPSWPCKPETAPDAVIYITESGLVELQPLLTMAIGDGPDSMASAVVTAASLDRLTDECGRVGLADLLVALFQVSSPDCAWLRGQIIWSVSLELELALLECLKTGPPSSDCISAETKSLKGVLACPTRLRSELFKAVWAGRALTEGCRNVASAAGKANVGGVQLQMAVYQTKVDPFILSCPQAPREER